MLYFHRTFHGRDPSYIIIYIYIHSVKPQKIVVDIALYNILLQYFVIIARVIFISHFSERGRK